MKKILFLSLAFILALTFVGCGQKNPPTRVGKSSINVSINWTYDTFADFLNDVEIYAEVKILKWLSEDPDGVYTTFQAQIQKVYKGSAELEGQEIKLTQAGSSKSNLQGFPLFSSGDILLAGLLKSESRDSYYIEGANLAIFKIGENENGKVAVGYHVAIKNLVTDFSKIAVEDGSELNKLAMKVKSDSQKELNQYQQKGKQETMEFLLPSVAVDVSKIEDYIKEFEMQ